MSIRHLFSHFMIQQQTANTPLPNPFRPFAPLQPKIDYAIFRGRAELAQRLILLPLFPEHRAVIALSGPALSGKTSFLNMLPSLLVEDYIFIQLTPISTPLLPETYFHSLTEQAREQVKHIHGLTLPPLPVDRNPYQAGYRWLENLNHRCNEAQIILLLDDFEQLSHLFYEGRLPFLRFLGLLQQVLQNLANIHLVLAGTHSLIELNDSAWQAHLPKARQLYLDPLPPLIAQGLLQQPILNFPMETLPAPLVEQVITATGGHPFLIQLFGHLLVEYLNQQQRRQAVLSDYVQVLPTVLEQAHRFFQRCMQQQASLFQDILIAAANEKQIQASLDESQQRYLKKQWLLNEHDELAIPLLGQWIAQYWPKR